MGGEYSSAAWPTAIRDLSQAAAVANLDQDISDPPTEAQVQAISDKIDELLAALRTANLIET